MIQYLLSKYNHEKNRKIKELRKFQKKEDAYQGRINNVQDRRNIVTLTLYLLTARWIVFQEFTIISGG
jgi:hypothetical protein